MHTFQAVVLIGGAGSKLHPLTASGTPKALLPVANEPLISFPLKALEESGIEDVVAVGVHLNNAVFVTILNSVLVLSSATR